MMTRHLGAELEERHRRHLTHLDASRILVIWFIEVTSNFSVPKASNVLRKKVLGSIPGCRCTQVHSILVLSRVSISGRRPNS